MSEHVVEETGEVRLQLFMSVFSVRKSFAFMHLPVCVIVHLCAGLYGEEGALLPL